jgi:methyl-accepting chemotaxis protein
MNGLKRWFGDMRVRYKILAGFGTIVLLMVVVAVVVYFLVSRAQELSRTTEQAVDQVLAGDALDLALTDRIAAFRDFLISGDEQALETYQSANSRYQTVLSSMRANLDDPDQIEQINTIDSRAAEWTRDTAEPGIALRRRTLEPGGPPVDSVIAFFRSTGRVDAAMIRQAIDEFRTVQDGVARAARADRESAIVEIRLVTVVSSVVAVILSILLAVVFAGSLARTLSNAVEFAAAVAEGDFTRRIAAESGDEIGQLTGTLNRMAGDLRRTIAGVTGSTTQVAAAAQQIAATSEEISATTDRQVRSTEETSSSMEEIASQITRVARSTESLATSVEQTSTSVTEMSNSIEQTATSSETLGVSVEQTSATIEEMVVSIGTVGRHVDETREITQTAEADARTGGEAVESTIHGMRRIHAEMDDLSATVKKLGSASASIGRISEVIEDIADQTNLLALNASIEAARAGEHGRGFSVVAQEIRRLAERSVESTREITLTIRNVIEDMQNVAKSSGEVAERTNEGIGLADRAGSALEKIIGSTGRTRELMEEVALATSQQIGAAQQAQEAIRQIQQVALEVRVATREQAKSSRQIAEAIENMNRRTKEVFAATAEQKKGGDMVLGATEQINQGARATQSAIQEMARAAQDLSAQASRLTQLVASFRV